jgi:hypothetical protein
LKRLHLVGFSMSDEMHATIAFMTWQQCGYKPDVVIDAGTSLRAGIGRPSVVLFEDDVQLAVGFWDITRYWQEHGLTLC